MPYCSSSRNWQVFLNTYNMIDNHNNMSQYYLEIDKYWVENSGYFRLTTKLELGMGITYGNLLFYNGVVEKSRDDVVFRIVQWQDSVLLIQKLLSSWLWYPRFEYNSHNHWWYPPTKQKILQDLWYYISFHLCCFKNYVSTLTDPFESPRVILLTYNTLKTDHIIMIYKYDRKNAKIG